jgi:hypothetical protein
MTLPEERKIKNGRTYNAPWDPSSFGPITGPYRSPRHITDWVLVGILIVTLIVLYFGVR